MPKRFFLFVRSFQSKNLQGISFTFLLNELLKFELLTKLLKFKSQQNFEILTFNELSKFEIFSFKINFFFLCLHFEVEGKKTEKFSLNELLKFENFQFSTRTVN